MRVLGIDPGYDRLGVSVIEKQHGKEVILFSDCLLSSSKLSLADRLLKVGQELENIIKEWQPSILSIEKLFITNNQKTATNVAEVRGMIIYLCRKHDLEIVEYTPLEIKMCISGYGRADKNQVISMVKKLVYLSKEPKYDDEYDAIAAGLTYLAREKMSK